MVEVKIALWKKTYHLSHFMAGEILPHSFAYECFSVSIAVSV